MRTLSLLILSCLLLLAACGDTDEKVDPPKDLTLHVSELELFNKIQQMEGAAREIWPEFHVKDYPVYLITETPESKGYFLNSPAFADESVKIEGIAGNLTFYRNDDYLDEIESNFYESQYFSYFYEINGVNHMVIRPPRKDRPYSPYDEYKNHDDNLIPLLFMNSLFRIHQLTTWVEPRYSPSNYILSEEYVLLNLILHDLMIEAYSAESEAEMRKYLAYYAGLKYEMLLMDDATADFTAGTAMATELSEGSARYIEAFAAERTIYPTIHNDPTHSYANELIIKRNGAFIEGALIWRTLYHTGAVVTHFLRELDAEVDASYRQGITPYKLTVSFLEMSDSKLLEAAAEARSAVDYSAYEERAADLMTYF